MVFFEFILMLVVLSGIGKAGNWYATERKEKRQLEHQMSLARLKAGLPPETAGSSSKDVQALHQRLLEMAQERDELRERLEHVETILTSSSLELNMRLNRLMADGSHSQANSGAHTLPGSPPPLQLGFAAPEKTSRLGDVFADRYEIQAELGRGGMGVVYKARDTKLSQIVTLKVLSPLIARDRQAMERFRHEASTTRSIDHPNVVRIFDLGEAGDEPYISMEFVPGTDLQTRIKSSGPLKESEAIPVLKSVASGLSAAHTRGVIHRDLKPRNVLLGTDGRVKLIDFGLAKSALMGDLTVSGFILGTPQYMSPEQIQGGSIDLRSDIYSFGVLAYELLTGRTPFEGESPVELSFKIVHQQPRPLRELASDCSDGYASLVERCLQKNPAARFQKTGELLTALDRLA